MKNVSTYSFFKHVILFRYKMNAQIFCKLLSMLEITKVMVVMVMTMMVEGDLDDLVIETSLGKLRGERLKSDTGKEVDIWASIPFAEPPVENLRYYLVLSTLYCVTCNL